jgi:hypothetical protein
MLVVHLRAPRLPLTLAVLTRNDPFASNASWSWAASPEPARSVNADQHEEVYLQQPLGFDDQSGGFWRLRKALHGLKQAARMWRKGWGAPRGAASPAAMPEELAEFFALHATS